MRLSASRTRNRRAAVALAVTAIALSACGTRQSDEALIATERGSVLGAATSQVTGTGTSSSSPPDAAGAAAGVTPAGTTGGTALPGRSGAVVRTGGTTGPASGSTSGTGGSTGSPSTGTTSKPAIGPAGESTTCSKRLSPIRIGQVGTYSGFIAPVTAGSKVGLAAWAAYVNSKGGVACHPVQVFAEDDGADSSQAAAAVQDLVENKKVVALVGDFVPLSIQGFKSAVESKKIPAVGGDVLGEEWNNSPYMFPQQAGIYPVLYGAYKQLTKKGLKKAAILYCVETQICPNAYKASSQGGDVKRAGAEIVYSAQVSLTQPDYQAQCQNAKNAGADILGLYVDGSSMTRVMRSCASIGYFPQIATSAVAIGASQTRDANVIKAGLALSPGVFPWTRADNLAQQTYQNAMKTYAPNTPGDGATSSAWVSGVLFAEAINRLGAAAAKDLTIADVMKGLGLVKNATLQGLAPPITFSAGESKAPLGRCYYNMFLQKDGTWATPDGSTYVCKP